MLSPPCPSCRLAVKARLRNKVLALQLSRRAINSKSWYWDTTPPSDQQLAAARWFFKQHPPRKLWTATEWRKNNEDPTGVLVPEVAFLGRSNVGKSSLLNAVLDSPGLNRVGPRPGKTALLHAWGLSATNPTTGGALRGWKGQTDTRVAVLDAPGYGYASRTEWGAEIVTYLKRRKQLRRVFVLIDAVHGVKKHDEQMLDLLRDSNIPHQLIASKIDRQKHLDASMQRLQEVAQPRGSSNALAGLGEILAVGGLEAPKNKNIGVSDVQWAVLRAAGIDGFAVENYLRLAGEEAMKHSAAPRSSNARSHLGETEVLPLAHSQTSDRPPRATTLSQSAEAPQNPRQHRSAAVRDPVMEFLEPEKPLSTELKPRVYRGMDALEEAVGLNPGVKHRPRTAASRSRTVARARASKVNPLRARAR
ncbi:ribosome biogenesis GTP-binding protein YsxC [Cyphellophora europaea CBS 101466]|uniref:Ribosome biogenesis GTP-binding protein YsxC n=1 Tax=Cyphellophora europaea (strain CBS 101466) TaxID=1220924 RepID=W2S3P1_CYPE1|nr:ribosome biogenesis GTP-binding protein YsxC [Cyphellophora europaea CBS 101466]ETN43321.1 ribosome biogenesis GTP-binding protein YsxC [Cyphellophora europaea CBS 101466]